MGSEKKDKLSKEEIKDLIDAIRYGVNKIERQNRKFMDNIHLMAIWDNLDGLEKDLEKLKMEEKK
jgi:hypothetical protein